MNNEYWKPCFFHIVFSKSSIVMYAWPQDFSGLIHHAEASTYWGKFCREKGGGILEGIGSRTGWRGNFREGDRRAFSGVQFRQRYIHI